MPPKTQFWETPAFKIRVKVAFGIIAVIVISCLTPNLALLRLAYTAVSILATLEICSMTRSAAENKSLIAWFLACFLSGAVYGNSVVGFWVFPPKTLLLLLFVTYGSDVMGWFIGNLIGGRIFKSRPFPKTSPKKTWEGTIASAFLLAPFTILVNLLWPSEDPAFTVIDWILVGGGILSIIGDYLASRIKRYRGVKDSGEILARYRFFAPIEALLGGSLGHGGYLDRSDSLAFTTSIICCYCIVRKILLG